MESEITKRELEETQRKLEKKHALVAELEHKLRMNQRILIELDLKTCNIRHRGQEAPIPAGPLAFLAAAWLAQLNREPVDLNTLRNSEENLARHKREKQFFDSLKKTYQTILRWKNKAGEKKGRPLVLSKHYEITQATWKSFQTEVHKALRGIGVKEEYLQVSMAKSQIRLVVDDKTEIEINGLE